MRKFMENVDEYIDIRTDIYIKRLKELVAIPSISEDINHRFDVLKALRWCGIRLKALGFETQYRKVGEENVYEGDHLPLQSTERALLPHILCASLGHDLTKRTLLIYGHVDVKLISPKESWKTDPFDLTLIDGFMYGRGVADDKGPVVAWMNAIEAFIQCRQDIPVNIRFLIEGGEETGSEGLRELLLELKNDFLRGIDFVAISDSYWLNMDTPCLTYGLRGVIYFYVYVDGSERDIHSGSHGGAVQEPLADLQALMSSLVDDKGEIMVPEVYDFVRRPEETELRRFKTLDFDVSTYSSQVQTRALQSRDKVEILRRRWLLPSISFHGIENSFDKIGAPTLIPKSVMGKFSIRIVPDQNPAKVVKQVISYLQEVHAQRCSGNELQIKVFRDGQPFLADVSCTNYRAAFDAIKCIWKKPPDLIRDGATISMAATLEERTGRDVVLIPMAECQNYVHEEGERMSVRNYIKGIKVFITYMTNLRTHIDYHEDEIEKRLEIRNQWRNQFY